MYKQIYMYTHIYLSIYMYIYICIKFYGPILWMECNCLRAIQSHYEETVYFLPEIPGTH